MNKSNNTLIAALIAVIFIFFGLFSGKTHKLIKTQQKAKELENTVSNVEKQAKVTELRLSDSLKVKQAEIEALSVTKKNVQSKYPTLLKATNIKAKDVDKITGVTTETHSVDTVLCEVDTFSGIYASYADDYAKISVSIDTLRNAIFDYTFRDSLTIINYTKRHSILFGLIKWKSYEGCRVITHNPKSTPISVVTISEIK